MSSPMADAVASNMLQPRRMMLGFALAPMLPGFYSTLLFGQPWAFPLGLILSYPTALLLGFPSLLFLQRRNWLAWWQLCLCGAVCVLPLLLLYAYLKTPPKLEAFDLCNGILLEGWGAFTGLVFWLLAISGTSAIGWRELLGLGR